jgi:mannosyltransferase OCH1-like enzyme
MVNKIPKIIHYCWFGGKPIPKKTLRYIKTWKEKCHDYKFMKWDETNFDYQKYTYTREAYENKKWAFVSDVCRLEKLYEYGGIYIDVNTKMFKNLDPLLKHGMFFGFEQDNLVMGMSFGARKNHPIIKKIIDQYYKKEHLVNDGKINYRTINSRIQEELVAVGIRLDNTFQQIDDITIYPKEYFCPAYWNSPKVDPITDNTYMIHYFGGTWHDDKTRKLQEAQRNDIYKEFVDKIESLERDNLKLIQEIAAKDAEIDRLNKEISSHLGVKRSMRLLAGNIKRKLHIRTRTRKLLRK